jgi:hypothetical protein
MSPRPAARDVSLYRIGDSGDSSDLGGNSPLRSRAGVFRTAWGKEKEKKKKKKGRQAGKAVILYALRLLFSTFHLPGFTRPIARHQLPAHP